MSYYRPPTAPPRHSLASFILPVLVLVAIALVLVWRFWPADDSSINPNAELRSISPGGKLADAENAAIELYRNAAPSVVNVANLALLRDRFTLSIRQLEKGVGTGLIWDKQGHIVTNYHVIQGAQAVRVTLANRKALPAKVVASDPNMDLAVLWIKADPGQLQPIPLGESSKLKVGQWAFAIGNPFGLDHSLAPGFVSALGREIESVGGRPIKSVIQTTAPINPGNSGGPLLDSSGRLIGVNTAILSPSGAWAGIGFAIPADDVNRVVTHLIRKGWKGQTASAGLGIEEVPDQVAQGWGLTRGVMILNVVPEGAAARAGLQPTRRTEEGVLAGDVILQIDDTPINTSKDLHRALARYRPGDQVTLTVWRNGERFRVQATLQEATR
ncbi:MAG: trypsin-like peptidase domain-containing protein [Gemmataceae bacterium]|nr:trypsin-like peptidase domain-containing protein [Gemmataceae bacterium]